MTDIQTAIARGIRAERARLRLTQQDLGHRLNLSRQTVTSIENEDRPLSVHELTIVCRALGVTLDRLIRDADPSDRHTLGLDRLG